MNPSPRPPTISDVAKAAGVGRATAARSLGGYGAVSSETRERVISAARELGYRSNTLARSVSTGRSHTLGVVVADIANPFFSGIVSGIVATATRLQYDVVTLSTHEDLVAEAHAVEVLLDKRVDGLIVASAAPHRRKAKHLIDAIKHVPVVLVDRVVRELLADTIVIDNFGAAKHAVLHLLDHQHRRVGYVWGPRSPIPLATSTALLSAADDGLWTESERLRGYLAALAERDIDFDPGLVTTSVKTEAAVADAIAAMLDGNDPPTALFASEEEAVLGALRALRRIGTRLPQDLSLVGMDDSSWADVMQPPLTMVRQPVDDMGRLAVSQVMARLEGRSGEPSVQTLQAHLEERASVVPPRVERGGD